MFLKSLELQGFKSFAGKTRLDFPGRVVAVVGPNGSGKSNLADAVRWVLGERSASELRGGKLESLIFSGAGSRPAASLARVTLNFDNSGRILPLDVHETELSRRVDKSGVSQFFLHDSEIRLKDLLPILSSARLGTRGLTIIGQGQSDIFVSSSPEERRLMIEEFLGLKEFRIKKAQAEKKLDSSNLNMEKVKAAISEITPHLRFLKRQRRRWEKRKEIEENLRELENVFFGVRFRELNLDLKKEITPLRELEEKEKEKAREVEAKELKAKEADRKFDLGGELDLIRNAVREKMNQRFLLEKELAKIEARIEIGADGGREAPPDFLEVVKLLVADITRYLKMDNVGEIKTGLQGWLQKLKAFQGSKNEERERQLEQEREKILEEIRKIDGELEAFREKEAQIIKTDEELNKEFRELVRELEFAKNEQREIERKMSELNFGRERVEMRTEELKHEWRAAGRAPEELVSVAEAAQGSHDLETIRKKILRLRGDLSSIGEIDQALIEEASFTEERYGFLEGELKDLEKAKNDLQKLIVELGSRIHDDFKKAFGLINDEFNNYFRLMFGGGRAKLKLASRKIENETDETDESEGRAGESESGKTSGVLRSGLSSGVEVELNLPGKKFTSLEMLSGGEKTLVSIAALFALISISPPPFLVLDEIDATLDEVNARRFADLVRELSEKTQFIIITHNRATMEVADVLYGVTMGEDGVSRLLSLKLEN